MEAQRKSGCKSEEKHNGSERQNSEDPYMKAMVLNSDTRKGKSCLTKEWRGIGDEWDLGQEPSMQRLKEAELSASRVQQSALRLEMSKYIGTHA